MPRINHGWFLIVATLIAPAALAQSFNQRYELTVPSVVSVTAEEPLATIIHDETDNNQRFDFQYVDVASRAADGAILTLETNQAFTHTVNSSSKRNARIRLRKSGAPRWTITTGVDQTDYASGDEVALVRAESNRAGDGRFRIRVRYLEEQFANTLQGDYEMVVTATITAK